MCYGFWMNGGLVNDGIVVYEGSGGEGKEGLWEGDGINEVRRGVRLSWFLDRIIRFSVYTYM